MGGVGKIFEMSYILGITKFVQRQYFFDVFVYLQGRRSGLKSCSAE